VGLYMVHDGQWWARTFDLDADGDPIQPAPPPELIGVRARDIDGAVRRLVSGTVDAYRMAANFQPVGVPEDAVILAWKPYARSALERLTNDRFR
jgi:hypothetical protein